MLPIAHRLARLVLPLACLAWMLSTAPAAGAVFQYAVPVATQKGTPSVAFLWLPPDAEQVRGVVVAGMTLMEPTFASDPAIRRACAAQGLAIVFLKCGLGAADVQRVLDDLAAASGYAELSVAPLLFVGHSAGGPPAKALAIRLADRCIGLVQFRGGAPGGAAAAGGDDVLPPGVPALMMIGQFDEFGRTMRSEQGVEPWEGGRAAMAAWRAADEQRLGCVVVEPGAGHFAWSDRNAVYLAQWIAAAARARVPADWPPDAREPVRCAAVDARTGWLSDAAVNKPGATPPPAPFAEFKGDPARANWHFDAAAAAATVAYHNPPTGGFGKRDQFISWTDATRLEAGVRRFFNEVKWVGDGQTFETHPTFADRYPTSRDPKGPEPRWAEAGEPVGHSTNGPIRMYVVGGPIEVAGDARLRIKFDALRPVTDNTRATFIAYHPGDGEYRHTEQVGMLQRGFAVLKDGAPQTITFPPLDELRAGGPPVELQATSDAGLPVEYYVAAGPAVIEAGRLRVSELPARAKLPVTVKVVAYQFGRGVEPRVKTAEPVEQTVRVAK